MTDRAGLDIGLELDTLTGADGNSDDHRTLLLLLLLPAGASPLVGDGIV